MNLTDWRSAEKIDQTEAARRLGISQATVSRIETGEQFPSPETAAQMVILSDNKITLADLSTAYLALRNARKGKAA